MNSASRSAAQKDGSPSMNTRSLDSPSCGTATWAEVLAMVRLMLEVALGGVRVASGASMMAAKAACVNASGATVTGYAVRKVHTATRTGHVVSCVPRGISLAVVSYAAAPLKSMRAIEHDGNGRR